MILSSSSWVDDAAVAAAQVAPVHVEGRIVRHREARRQFLIEVDPEAWVVVGPVIAVLERWPVVVLRFEPFRTGGADTLDD
jgi:hypothetical protein